MGVGGDCTCCTAAITSLSLSVETLQSRWELRPDSQLQLGLNSGSEFSPGCSSLLSPFPSLGLNILVWKMGYRPVPVTVLIRLAEKEIPDDLNPFGH